MTHKKAMTNKKAAQAAPALPRQSGAGTQRAQQAQQVSPADLPRTPRATIALIDVDNIVIGRDGRIDAVRAHAALAEVYVQLGNAELSLAVVSEPTRVALGSDVCFRFTGWTWRAAEIGKDAADHQLCDFALTVLEQRMGARVAIASGDHIFAALADVTDIEVVVPRGHHGVARALRPYLRVRRPADRRQFELAT